jgi:hypothetical protein
MERMGINPACPKGFTGQIAFGHSHLLQVFFTSGGDGPGMGCRETGAVVARALPEFATRQVVTCYDRYPRKSIITNRQPYTLAGRTSSGRNWPSRVIPPNLYWEGAR